MTLTASVIIVWLLIGLVIGGLARLLVPGRQHIGLILTILIGIVAALLGGIITTAIIGAGHAVITFMVAQVSCGISPDHYPWRARRELTAALNRLNSTGGDPH